MRRGVFLKACAVAMRTEIIIVRNNENEKFMKIFLRYFKAMENRTVVVDWIHSKVLSIKKFTEPDTLSVHVSSFLRLRASYRCNILIFIIVALSQIQHQRRYVVQGNHTR